MKTTLDLYTDYLLSSFGQTSATNLSRLLNEQISHDDVRHFLSQPTTLWKTVKPLVRQHQHPDGVLIVDDSLAHKPHSHRMVWSVPILTIPLINTSRLSIF